MDDAELIPRLDCLGLIEAYKRVTDGLKGLVVNPGFRGLIASASLKHSSVGLTDESSMTCRRFRGLIASASLKPNLLFDSASRRDPGMIPRLDCLGLIEAIWSCPCVEGRGPRQDSEA